MACILNCLPILAPKLNFCGEICQFLTLKLHFFRNFWPKESFFWKKLVKFGPYTQFFPNFWPKKMSFFILSSAQACFSLTQKVLFFFFFLKIGHFLSLILNFFPNFWPKRSFFFFLSSASAFFFARKVHFFCKISQFLDLIPKFFPIFDPQTPFFMLKLSPSFFFGLKTLLFFLIG